MLRHLIAAMLTIGIGLGTAYAKTEVSVPATANPSVAATQQAGVDLNSADADTLMTLHGIGKVKAQAIITYRQQHGKFREVQDLTNIKGFSQNMLTKLQKNNPGRISVN